MIFGHPIQKLVLDRFWITFGRRRDAPLEVNLGIFCYRNMNQEAIKKGLEIPSCAQYSPEKPTKKLPMT